MGKVISIGGGKRFAVGATLGYGGTFAEKQRRAYEREVGAVNNFADDTIGARQFAYRTKSNKAMREATVMALTGTRVTQELAVAA